MGKLNHIIKNATPGPWVTEVVYRDSAGEVVDVAGPFDTLVVSNEDGVCCTPTDARFIATFDPEHIGPMNDVCEAVLDLVKCPICAMARDKGQEHGSLCPLGHLLDYRKERGLDG